MNRIKELRKAKKITVTELSKALEIPQSTLTNYENGKRTPRDQETWQQIADYFGVSISFLMGIEENYHEIGEEAFLILKERSNQKYDNSQDRFQGKTLKKALDYFDENSRSKLIDKALLEYQIKRQIKPDYVSNGLLIEVERVFYSEYLQKNKSNQNLIQWILDTLPVPDEITDYKTINKLDIKDPTKNNEFVHISEVSLAINNDLENELVGLLKNLSKSLLELSEKYPDIENDSKIEIYFWNKDNSSGDVGNKTSNKITSHHPYTDDDVRYLLDFFRSEDK